MSELGYQCLIRRVIDHYGQFKNDSHNIPLFLPKCIIEHGFLKFCLQLLECDIYDLIQDGRQK